MKKSISCLILLIAAFLNVNGQSVVGKWKTIDDDSGKPKSIVEIYERDGKIYGKVLEILEKEHKKDVCKECTGSDKDKPILGMVIIKGLSKKGNEYRGGQILDPQNGKLYKAIIALDGKDKLKVRGYIGISVIGRTQYWYRVGSK